GRRPGILRSGCDDRPAAGGLRPDRRGVHRGEPDADFRRRPPPDPGRCARPRRGGAGAGGGMTGDPSLWETLAAPLAYEFMLKAMLGGAAVGALCGLLSCFVTL